MCWFEYKQNSLHKWSSLFFQCYKLKGKKVDIYLIPQVFPIVELKVIGEITNNDWNMKEGIVVYFQLKLTAYTIT